MNTIMCIFKVLRHTLSGYSVHWLNLEFHWLNSFVAYNNSKEFRNGTNIHMHVAKTILGRSEGNGPCNVTNHLHPHMWLWRCQI